MNQDTSSSPPAPVGGAARRERRILLTAGALAALGGAGWGAWRLRLAQPADEAASAFWGAHFVNLAGAQVAMAGFRGQPLLLNFWATWCPPCVDELPLLNRFYAAHRAAGWTVLGLALDRPEKVQPFLQRMPLDFPVVLGDAAGTALTRMLGNDKGGLPFSVLFASNGAILKRKMGKLTEQDLQDWRQSA